MKLWLAIIPAFLTSINAYSNDCRNRGVNKKLYGNTGCWLQWSGWSECTGVCGRGMKVASRKCKDNNGFAIPEETAGCGGSAIRRRACDDTSLIAKDGDSCAYWSYWSEWSSCVSNGGDPCSKSSYFGKAKRTRTCNDPSSIINGQLPRCTPDPVTSVYTEEFRSCNLPIPDVFYPDQSDYIPGPYGECDTSSYTDSGSPCGPGTQTSQWTHKCAHIPDTIIPAKYWFRPVVRTCKADLCCPSEWTAWTGVQSPCSEYKVTRYRQVGEDCRYNNEEKMAAPSVLPTPCTFEHSEDGWAGCEARPAPWNPNVRTTCGGNGVETRVCKNFCASECAFNDYNCKWLQEPWSFTQERACGPQTQSTIKVTCDPAGCKEPVCHLVEYCEGDRNSYKTPVVVPCAAEHKTTCRAAQPTCCLPGQDCGSAYIPKCQPLNSCGCSDNTMVYKSSTCGIPNEPAYEACPPLETQCYWSEWMYSETLQRAIRSNQCVCDQSLDHREYRVKTCQTKSSNGQICSQIKEETEYRVYSRAQRECLSAVQSEDCPTQKCLQPGESPASYEIFQIDYCTNTRKTVQIKECPYVPPCCVWSNWEYVPCQDLTGTCPSEAPMQMKIRRNTCPDRYPDEIEPSDHKCTVSCPPWAAFGDWSECNNILMDGTNCGGYRTRSRTYLCPADVTSGVCNPSGFMYSSDPYVEHDTSDIKYHSQYCYSKYMEETNKYDCDAWSDWTVDVDNTCTYNNEINMVQTRSCTNKCTNDPPVTHTNRKVVPSTPCFDAPVSIYANGTATSCRYSTNGCTATVSYDCLASSPCTQSYTKTRLATASECPITVEPIVTKGPCRQISQDPLECYGECEVTHTDKCTNQVLTKFPEACHLGARWTELTPLTVQPIDPSWLPITDYVPFRHVDCPVCGGTLVTTKSLICVDEPKTYYKSYPCAKPVWNWSNWSACDVCSDAPNPADRICTSTRTRVTHAMAQDQCQPPVPSIEAREINLRACGKTTYDYYKYCAHTRDPTATCGQGIVHTVQIVKINHIVTGKPIGQPAIRGPYPFDFLDARNGSSIDYLSSASESRKRQDRYCHLRYSPVKKISQWTECPVCGGGERYQTTSYDCDGYWPHGLKPSLYEDTIKTLSCPAPVKIPTPSEWTALSWEVCSMCQVTRRERRICQGGNFNSTRTDCSCGRCCDRSMGSRLINFNTEERDAPCPMVARPPVCTIVKDDPLCECGSCTSRRICRDPCDSSIIISNEPGPVNVINVDITYGPWSTCIYDDNVCKSSQVKEFLGFQKRSKTGGCLDNRIIRTISVEEKRDGTCRETIEPFVDHGQCIKKSAYNQCEVPQRTIKVGYFCRNQLYLEHTYVEDCETPEEPEVVGEWGPCSTECGRGIRTRDVSKLCSKTHVRTETEDCGCPSSVWSDWSEFQKEADVCVICGPETQYVHAVRTCKHPQQSYGFNSFDSYSRYSNPCFAKCNFCKSDPITGESTSRQRPFNSTTIPSCQGAITESTIPSMCPTCPPKNYGLTKNFYQCDKVLNSTTIPCPENTDPEVVKVSKCNVPCGLGVQEVITTQTCKPPTSQMQECIGEYGNTIEIGPSAWSNCSAECDGGVTTRETITVCEDKPDIVLQKATERKSCANGPCSYWAGWTNWGLCSASCDEGVTRRYRHCVGAVVDRYGKTVSACEGDSVETQPCKVGNCCEFPWSGWSNCCNGGNGERRRLKWRGFNTNYDSSCNGKWEEQLESCGSYQDHVPTDQLQDCNSLRTGRSAGWHGGVVVEVLRNSSISTTVSFTPRVVDGKYTTSNGWKYEVVNGQWFRYSGFGSRNFVDVTEEYFGGAWNYMIYKQWYKFTANGRLIETYKYNDATTTQTNVEWITRNIRSGSYSIDGVNYEVTINNQGTPEFKTSSYTGQYTSVDIREHKYANEYYYYISNAWYKFVNGGFVKRYNVWDNTSVTKQTTIPKFEIIDTAQNSLKSHSVNYNAWGSFNYGKTQLPGQGI